MNFFRVQLANFGKHEQLTSLCTVLTFGLRKFEQRNLKKLLFGFLWWSKLARPIPAQLLIPLFKIATEEVNARCHYLSLKSRTCKKHKNLFHRTACLMKQKKAKINTRLIFVLLLCLLLIDQTLWRSHSISSGFVFHQGF